MLLKARTNGLVVFLLTAFVPGFHLQRNGISILPRLDPETRFYRPVLQHNETLPTPGSYMLRDFDGRPCIKVTMGAEYVVMENKINWYFNLDPSRVTLSGKCGKEEALLYLMLPDNSGSLEFTFRKDEDNFYVTKLAAQLSPLPVCKGCPNKTYSGFLSQKRLFKAEVDRSFKCTSELLLSVSSELQIKLVPLQMQAFGVPNGQFGKEDECWADFNRRAIPIIIGSIVLGFILSAVLSFLIIRDRHPPTYERL
ncbi:PREDICTED: lysosome-associated membrane glycoprotein 3 [Cyprinodon variegatus]|uniref:lysosome-associated membrane glycoprotein 3 n=1 Tax=Cyprinodon variegatus TaxID=28743 RepID=UPI0007425341|nr:PREDICTED: lysosome-associated membrane glycoprotein 3 [Cyprinodon variegatus]